MEEKILAESNLTDKQYKVTGIDTTKPTVKSVKNKKSYNGRQFPLCIYMKTACYLFLLHCHSGIYRYRFKYCPV